MSNTIFSAAGLRAVPDPMADIFKLVGQNMASFPAAHGGKEFLSLAAGSPDDSLLPHDLFTRFATQVLAAPGRSPLNYTMPQGLPPLRAAFHTFLSAQGLKCNPDDMLITSGGMEALSLGAWLTLNEGDVVVTEGPGFPGILSVFELLGAKVVQVPCAETGMTPDALEAAIKTHRPKLVSLMPDYQNPTGAVMPLEHRKAIAGLLETYDLLALEDGAYSQLRFEGEILPPLQSFAPARVLYATSVSKILMPAMRIGVLVAPSTFVKKAEDIKSGFNMQASALNQAVTAMFLNGDELAPRLKLLCKTYKVRRDAMLAALEKYVGAGKGYTWTRPKGGMFLWLTGPSNVDFDAVFTEAVANGMAYVAGNKFYAVGANAPKNSARLNFASTDPQKIDEAIRRLAVTLGLRA